MRRTLAAALCVSGCSYAPAREALDLDGPQGDTFVAPDATPDADPNGPWLPGFAFRRQLTIDRTTGTQVLSDFPVGIVIGADGAIAQHATGSDFAITRDDMLTRLDSEVAGYTSATGAAEIWTRVPELPVGQTKLFLYYGGAPAVTNPEAVWPQTTFKGVWHLSDPALSSAALDSTTANHTLDQPTPLAVPGHAAGIAGLGRTHGAINDELLTIADPADGSLDVGTSSFSFGMWVKPDANLGDFDQPFYKGGTSTSNRGYCLMLGNGAWHGKLHDGTTFRDVNFATTPPVLGGWFHLAIVVDRGTATAQAYLNGAMTSTIALPLGSLDTTEDLRVGRGSGGAQFSGTTDEVRIYNTALTADWIATEYANLATPGFLALGGEQQQPN